MRETGQGARSPAQTDKHAERYVAVRNQRHLAESREARSCLGTGREILPQIIVKQEGSTVSSRYQQLFIIKISIID